MITQLQHPESPSASSYEPSVGVRQNIYTRRKQPVAVVIHTTGCGPVRRWKKELNGKFARPSPFETGVRIYTELMNAGPHYLIGQLGQCVQLCPEELAAWHVGRARRQKYFIAKAWKPSVLYQWWFDRWAPFGVTNPRELAGGQLWQGGSVNDNSIGIEVVPPDDDPRAPWSEACTGKLLELLEELGRRHGIPLEAPFVVTHSDAHPVSRTSSNGQPWDPGPRQWRGLALLNGL